MPVQIKVHGIFFLLFFRKRSVHRRDSIVQIRGKAGLCFRLGLLHRLQRGLFRLETPLRFQCFGPCLFLRLPSGLKRLRSGFFLLAALCLSRCIHMDLYHLASDRRALAGSLLEFLEQFLDFLVIHIAFLQEKYFTPLSNTFMSCSPVILIATRLPRLSICAIFPYILPSGLVIPSMQA